MPRVLCHPLAVAQRGLADGEGRRDALLCGGNLEVHEFANAVGELLLGANGFAVILTEDGVDFAARSAVEHGKFLSHEARHEIVEGEVRVLGSHVLLRLGSLLFEETEHGCHLTVLGEPMMWCMSSQHPVLAVVDEQQDHTVVWHVQTAPGMAEGSGKLSGAWVVSADGRDVSSEHLAGILEGTRVVSAAEPHLDSFVDALRSAVNELTTHPLPSAPAPAASSAQVNAENKNPKARSQSTVSVPRFPALTEPSPESIEEGYHGEPIGSRAWAVATALAELVTTWQEIERIRRGRKYLREAFGPDIRPLPLPH